MAKKADHRKALADAVKSKSAEGLVRVYPTGLGDVPGFAAEEQTVTEADAVELLMFVPAAFTLSESGKPTSEQKAMSAAAFESAWQGASEPEPPADEKEQ